MGPIFTPSLPGCASTCDMTVTVLTVTGTDAACSTPTSLFTYNTVTNKLKVGTTQLRSITCTTAYQVLLQFARAADATQSTTCLVEVATEETNIAPVMAPGTCGPRYVNERSLVGTQVGTALVATDENPNQPHIWTIESTARYPFALGVCDGIITVTELSLNFTRQSSYVVPIKVTDAGIPPALSASCTITIYVNDVSDPPVLLTSELSVYENSPVGTAVGTVTAFDIDSPVSSLTYSWSRADSPDAFAISSTGVVTTRLTGIDFETKNVYYYRVLVSDGAASAVGDLTIRVLNENDPPVVSSSTSRTIAENTAPGTLLSGGAVSATDQDGDAITFSLFPSTVFTLGAGNNVYVAAGAALNFETAPSYSLTLVATDARGAVTYAPFTVSLTNVNEAPTFVAGVSTRSMPESIAPGTAIGLPIAATDPDAGTVLTYQILSVSPSSGAGLFSIDGTTGLLRTASGAAFDYEQGVRAYIVSVRVADNGVPVLSSSIDVTVSVTDVNEAPVWGASLHRFSIAESAAANAAIASVSATDPEGSAVTYQLLSSSSKFSLSAAGALTLARGVDFETDAAETLVVQASDTSGTTSTTLVTISITDVNEAPVFPPDARVRFVYDGAAAGMSLGNPVRAADPDNAQTLAYTVSQNTYFDIHAITGQLFVRTNLPATGGPVRWYTVDVTVYDSGVPQLSATVTVNITLQTPTVINRPPVLSSSTVSIHENLAVGAIVANVSLSVSDPDGNALIFSLSGAANLPFVLSENTGLLTLARAIDFEAVFSYTFVVTVTDVPTVHENVTLSPQSASASWTVNVLDVNERCSFVGAAFTLQENVVMGTSVGTALRASDPDNNAAETTTYTITSGNSGNIFS
ncbi:MAG: cadherin repeat domain-containing protein, partial [Methanosarcinales archaeon]